MTKQKNYNKTLIACYLGFVTQAISANFTPLLFLTFKNTYGIGLEKIALIPLVFYLTQLLIDLAAKGVKCSFHRGHSSISIPNSIRFQYNRNELKKQAKGNDFRSRGK